MILAGDIGGTSTRLAVIHAADGKMEIVFETTFPSREKVSLESAVEDFLSLGNWSITCASFGIAGPVVNGRCEATNLPWVVESRNLAKRLRMKRVALLNDLSATAHGIALLEAKDFVVLNRGVRHAKGNMAIISAGTGLGEAGMYWDGQSHLPFDSEGGHADFAPRNPLEIELLGYLMNLFPRVSYERIISGPGLVNVYRFLRDTKRGDEPPWLAEEIRQGDLPEIISRHALSGKSTLCEKAMELFVSVYGAEAGNLALKLMAVGGIYLGGGIAPKIIQKLKGPVFMHAFTSKGRMKPLLQNMPVRVVMNPKTALLGAARYALVLRGFANEIDFSHA